MMTAGSVTDEPSIGQYRTIFSGGCEEREEKASSGGGVMVQAVNHATGANEWKMMPRDYDYQQELARAAFADMLHDSERNRLYYEGLAAAVRLKREAGQPVHVLDIGTGTGLLSMMAASLGADTVTACEEFRPMAECAARVIADNGFGEKIKLVRKRSTELEVGPGRDLEQRANILVTEVFDTELIGEGAISTYNHAARELLTAERVVVPGVARVWAQVVTSARCRAWAEPRPLQLDTDTILAPAPAPGSGHTSLALHDLQLSQFPPGPDTWQPVTPPAVVFSLDLAATHAPIPETARTVTRVRAGAECGEGGAECDAVLMWWDCWTDPAHSILLSCAPRHASHHAPDTELPWRDHWMQAIYYPKTKLKVRKGEEFNLVSCHDEYSLWFDVASTPVSSAAPVTLPSPEPGLHLAMSRLRLGQVNNQQRAQVLAGAIKKVVSDIGADKTVLVISEQSLLGLMAAKLGAKNVVHICEENNHIRDYIGSCAIANNLQDRLSLHSADWLASADLSRVAAVLAEPQFTVSVLPWHNLLYWFILSRLELPASARVMPGLARLYCVPVHYTDLWKIRAPLHEVEGFKMTHFDAIIEAAASVSDNTVEPHPLWEYPAIALGEATLLAELDLTTKVPSRNIEFSGECLVTDRSKALNGVALWMEWQLDAENTLSGGPVSPITVGTNISWDMDSKQGVSFLPPSSDCTKIKYNIAFVPSEGDFTFKFKPL